MHKGFKMFGREGSDPLTKDLKQLYRITCLGPIYIKEFMPQEKRRAQEDKITIEKNITTKNQRNNDVK